MKRHRYFPRLNLTALTISLMLSPVFGRVGITESSMGIVNAQENLKPIQNCQAMDKKGEFEEARKCFEKLLESLPKEDAKISQSDRQSIYFHLAQIHYLQGHYIQARRFLESLKNDNSKDENERTGWAYNLRGLTEAELENYKPEALDNFQQALKIFENLISSNNANKKDVKDLIGYKVTTLLSIADVNNQLSDQKNSAKNYKDALQVLLGQNTCKISPLTEKEKESKLGDLSSFYKVLKACVMLGKNQEYLNENLEYKQELQNLLSWITPGYEIEIDKSTDTRLKALIYYYIGDAYSNLEKKSSEIKKCQNETQGDQSQAQANFKKSEDILNQNTRIDDYYYYVKILVNKKLGEYCKEKGDYAQAISKYEKVNDLTLIAFEKEKNDLSKKGKRLNSSEIILRDKIIENNFIIYQNIISSLNETSDQPSDAVSQEAKEKIFKYIEAARTGVDETDKTYETERLKALIPDEQTTLVEYFVTEKQLFIALVNKKEGITILPTAELPNSSKDDIKKQIDQFYQYDIATKGQSCTPTEKDLCYPNSLKNLYEILFKPIQNKIVGTRLIIVPHGILHYVPFAALNDGKSYKSYLVENYAISMLPSASHLSNIKKPKNQVDDERINVVALANPTFDLPFSQEEVESIQKDLSKDYNLVKPLYGQNATFKKLNDELGKEKPTIIHLSTHNELDLSNSQYTSLILYGEKLSSRNINNTEHGGLKNIGQTNLVVLSACQTEIGEITKGDEVFGLTSAFLEFVPSVVASLWNVDDHSTSQLMKKFYEQLAKPGVSKDVALQDAQKALLTDPKFSHPFHWAAFILTGDSHPIRTTKESSD